MCTYIRVHVCLRVCVCACVRVHVYEQIDLPDIIAEICAAKKSSQQQTFSCVCGCTLKGSGNVVALNI